MSKDAKTLAEGLETAEANVNVTEATPSTEKVKKERKPQTTEDRDVLVAGVELMKSMGNISEKFGKVLELAVDWNGDAESLEAAKKTAIEGFGGSSELKNYIDEGIAEDNKGYAGITKLMPIINNIISFYARRNKEGVKKSKTKVILISGKTYRVNEEYLQSLASLPASERRDLVLQHADTKEEVVDSL